MTSFLTICLCHSPSPSVIVMDPAWCIVRLALRPCFRLSRSVYFCFYLLSPYPFSGAIPLNPSTIYGMFFSPMLYAITFVCSPFRHICLPILFSYAPLSCSSSFVRTQARLSKRHPYIRHPIHHQQTLDDLILSPASQPHLPHHFSISLPPFDTHLLSSRTLHFSYRASFGARRSCNPFLSLYCISSCLHSWKSRR